MDGDALGDKFVHLANNSVQKKSKRFAEVNELIGKGSMWHSDTFIESLDSPDVWTDKIQPSLKNAVLASLQSAAPVITPRRGCFELFGYGSSSRRFFVEVMPPVYFLRLPLGLCR